MTIISTINKEGIVEFPLQQCLRERAPVLRFTYISYLVLGVRIYNLSYVSRNCFTSSHLGLSTSDFVATNKHTATRHAERRMSNTYVCKNTETVNAGTSLERTNTSPRYSATINKLGYQITVMIMMMMTAATTPSYGAAFLLNRESHRWPINFPPFMKAGSTSVCSQDPATDSYPEIDKSSPHPHCLYPRDRF
jgi:hypothetical protein